jgi:hypothetical protein
MLRHRHFQDGSHAACGAAALLLWSTLLSLQAAEPVADSSTPAALIRGLGSGSLSVRDEAERRLLALGPAALPDVAAARPTATGEAAFRLNGIQRQLEQQAAERAIEASVSSFDWREAPVRQCLEELFARTGNAIPIDGDVASGPAAMRPVTGRFERTTFWEVLDGLLDRAGLELSTAAEPPGLKIVAAASAPSRARQPCVASGPFRITVARVEQVGKAGGQDGAARAARIVLRAAWEPRLEPFLVRLPARTIVAEGPAGESVPPAQRTATLESTIVPGREWVEMPVLLARPEAPLETLGMLRGTLSVWLAGMEQAFVFPAVQAPDTVRIADAEVRLLEVASRPQGLLIRIRVTYGSPSEALASHQTWLTERRVEAALADGRALEQVEQRVEARTDRGLTAAVIFAWPARGPAAPPPVTISWRLPIAIHEIPVDFAIRDIPLEEPERR